MTAPKFIWQFTPANIIQILLLVFGIGGFAIQSTANITANERSIVETNKTLTETRGTILAQETRLRAVETNGARAEERLTSIYTLLSRIDAKLERIERGPASR